MNHSAREPDPLTIFFSVGEPSGDLHGANLIRALRERRPGARFVGYGGPRMAAAGCELHTDLTALAVMWFSRVLINLHVFYGLMRRADRYFRDERPDAVVLIDYPGFNWWIARKAKRRGIPVFYYSPPQVWAWAGWRVKKMRRFVDHVLCGLPFEESWFRERGCNATFVGHPYFDEIEGHSFDEEFVQSLDDPDRPLVTILPGSRTQEVTHNLRWFLKAAGHVRRQAPTARFAVAAFKPRHAEIARGMIEEMNLEVDVHVGRTPELIRSAVCCMACSGSVSLELLYHEKPTVVLYWISRFAYFVQGFFRKVKYITLVNLLTTDELFPDRVEVYNPDRRGAEPVLFPEYLTWEDKSERIASHVARWLTQPMLRRRRVEELRRLKQQVARGGASKTAAKYIFDVLRPSSAAIPRPHMLSPGMESVGGERGTASEV